MSRANLQAFPVACGSNLIQGMTIREFAAFEAMKGIIASGRNSSSVVLDAAAEAREYADAMIDELEREPRR